MGLWEVLQGREGAGSEAADEDAIDVVDVRPELRRAAIRAENLVS